jgi:hypothetical protein
MALRGSAKNAGKDINLRVVLGEEPDASGIDNARALIAFVEAFIERDDRALAQARTVLVGEMGTDAMIDAAAVAANFQRMVRIADATGIPVDEQMSKMTRDIQEQLELRRFASARNTPAD